LKIAMLALILSLSETTYAQNNSIANQLLQNAQQTNQNMGRGGNDAVNAYQMGAQEEQQRQQLELQRQALELRRKQAEQDEQRDAALKSEGSNSSGEDWWFASGREMDCKLTPGGITMREFTDKLEKDGTKYSFGDGREKDGYYLILLSNGFSVWAKTLEHCQLGTTKEKLYMPATIIMSDNKRAKKKVALTAKNILKKYNEIWTDSLTQNEFLMLWKKHYPNVEFAPK